MQMRLQIEKVLSRENLQMLQGKVLLLIEPRAHISRASMPAATQE